MITCPKCKSENDDGEYEVFFCPSYPDKCGGCEIDPNRLRCIECDYEWELK